MDNIREQLDIDAPIQIMPAPKGLYARYYDETEGHLYAPIVCMALTNGHEIKFCDTDAYGVITPLEVDYKNPIYKYNTETKEYEVYNG